VPSTSWHASWPMLAASS